MIVRILKKHGSLPGKIGTTIHVCPTVGNPLSCLGYCVVEQHGEPPKAKRSVIKKPKKASDEQERPADSGQAEG